MTRPLKRLTANDECGTEPVGFADSRATLATRQVGRPPPAGVRSVGTKRFRSWKRNGRRVPGPNSVGNPTNGSRGCGRVAPVPLNLGVRLEKD